MRFEDAVRYKVGYHIGRQIADMVKKTIMDNEPESIIYYFQTQNYEEYGDEILKKYNVHADKNAIRIKYLSEQANNINNTITLISSILQNGKSLKYKLKMIMLALNDLLEEPDLESASYTDEIQNLNIEDTVNEILECLHESYIRHNNYIDAVTAEDRVKVVLTSIRIDDMFEAILCRMYQLNIVIEKDLL